MPGPNNIDAIRQHTKDQLENKTLDEDFPSKTYRMVITDTTQTPATIEMSNAGMDKCADLLLAFI